ncbi:sporulation protein YunB [Paenibacillus sp. sptzw28]|uniref:sporulation protein YunB n=1 Tax=Paenibacillus sp. sptzw28 TaxID=715179 RepID=UPI001C6E696E|nr:sporulation protein YunB [Paenibacillus sp. sptzw28]QYR20691.1 sporulation protein YunB [Paenibacillus sp. sptzw28]
MPKWGRRGWRSSRLRRTGKASRGKLWLFALLIVFLFFFQSFVFVERNLQGPLMALAKIRVKQVATQAINEAISEQAAVQTDAQKLIDWKTNAGGKISGFMLNYAEHMKITSETAEKVQSILNETGDLPQKIPLGQALGSSIIASFGPRIPFKFEPAGAVKVDLETKQQDAGINMILVEVYMHIVAEVSIIIPFDTQPELVETEIPISYLLVVGDVPMYYYDNKGNPVGDSAAGAPTLSLPMQNGQSGISTPNTRTNIGGVDGSQHASDQDSNGTGTNTAK